MGDMPLPAKFFIAFVIVLALIGGVAWLVRRFGSGGLGAASARGRQARLGVIEATAVDSRRRLVLVRRDNVEHLIMLGGPTDVVVEANIVRGQPAAPMRDVPAPRMEQPGRPAAAENGLWPPAAPLAPEPAFRAGRGGERGMIQPIAEDLPLQPQAEPTPRPQTVDRLAGLAAELGRSAPPPIVDPRLPEPRSTEPRLAEPRMSEPRMPEMRAPEPRMPDMRAQEPWMPEPRTSEPRMPEPRIAEPRAGEPRMPEPRMPEPRTPEHRPADARRPLGELRRPLEPRRPPAPPAAPAAGPAGEHEAAGDRQLAAMAEQLEAALRRSGGTEPPSEPAAEAAPGPLPAAPSAGRPRPSLRSPLEPRSSLLRGTSPARPTVSEPPPPPPAPPAETASEPVSPSAPEEPAQAQAAPPGPPAPEAQDGKPSGKTAYESLEEEMANLLGRAPGKP